MQSENIIETDHLTKQYGRQTAVNDLNFSVREGEVFGFLGPNGAGKTTTLLMLLGLTQPSGGNARVCGMDPSRNPREVKRRVGYLPENVGFYGDLNAIQSLQYVASLNGLDKSGLERKVRDTLDLVGLGQEAAKKVNDFSRGMRQRLGIAEVLIKDPHLLIMDEPTLGLDPEGAVRLMDFIVSLNRDRNMTVLLSSHNLHQVQKISHRVGIMIEGHMVAMGSIDALGKEKFGLGEREYSLEEIYMKYFQEV